LERDLEPFFDGAYVETPGAWQSRGPVSLPALIQELKSKDAGRRQSRFACPGWCPQRPGRSLDSSRYSSLIDSPLNARSVPPGRPQQSPANAFASKNGNVLGGLQRSCNRQGPIFRATKKTKNRLQPPKHKHFAKPDCEMHDAFLLENG
jgi:hypothetical protein